MIRTNARIVKGRANFLQMLNVGVIGFGYWGPHVVRNFHANEHASAGMVCDTNDQALKRAQKLFPHVKVTKYASDVFTNPEIDIVAIATPVYSHYELARKALENGKHIFVEKPFTSTSAQAKELIDLAEAKNLKIMVDHTFLFTGSVKKMKELIDRQELGELYYYDSRRVNLGLFQSDVNVIWDLGAHDFSILDYLIPEKPIAVSAHGIDHFGRDLENIAYVTAFFADQMIAHFSFNWLSPVKVRETLISGSQKMLVWDDIQTDEKIKIYDKGVKVDSKEGLYELLVEYRQGDMYAPKLDRTEALYSECDAFIQCILNNKTPMNDGHAGLRIVRMLEASDESLKNNGKIIQL